MIQKNLKKEYTSNLLRGFTLMELLIGSLIASVACLAIIYSSTYYTQRLYNVKLRERAHDELRGYTEFWKTKIFGNDVSSAGGYDSKQVCLLEENNICTHQATLQAQVSDIENIENPNSHVKRKGLTTSIEWNTRSNVKKEIEFYLEQLVRPE